MSALLPNEWAVLAALDRALEEAAASARPVGVVTLREPHGFATDGGGPADVALQALPPGSVAGRLSTDRLVVILPGFGEADARAFAQQLAVAVPSARAGHAAAEPDRPPRGPADLIADAEASSCDPGRKRVLVVEDEPALARILEAFLTASGGFDVVVAHSGEEALRRCAEEAPALAVVDLELPDVDGAELIRRLRERVADLPAVACSGKRPETAAGAGFTRYFRKPFDMRTLVGEIQRIVGAQLLGVPGERC